MRSLSARVPPPAGVLRWTQEMADRLIGMKASLSTSISGAVAGEVVAATVLDDDLGHALWVTVQANDEGEDVIAAGLTANLSPGRCDWCSCRDCPGVVFSDSAFACSCHA